MARKNVTWRQARFGAVRFPTCTAKARYLLKRFYNKRYPHRSKHNQTEIAKMCGLSTPRVNQIIHEKA